MSSRRKFTADKLAKRYVKKEKNIEDENEFSSEAEESEVETELKYNPSLIRKDDVPEIDVTEHKKADFEDHADFSESASDAEEDYSNEEEEGQSGSDDVDELAESGDESDHLLDIKAGEVDALAAEIEQIDEEAEESDIVSLVAKQREEDLKIAHGVSTLQDQKKRILTLFLKIHPLISLINQLPPVSLDDDAEFSPYSLAAEDPEINQAFTDACKAIDVVCQDFAELRKTLDGFYKWEEDTVTDKMMDIISHWGQKLRQAAGIRSGTVINRPIEQQITSSLRDMETLTQPSRRVTEKRVFGVEKMPDFLRCNYNDDDFYDRLLREIVAEKNPDVLAKVKKTNPTKAGLKSKQISYEEIPELRNYMTATMQPVPDSIDAMLKSLMGGK
ncbi:hypothetical protein TVAG_067070 [Trichomonas vaginalis G3]|uniref:AATF leucine zipper-containing domain-containing protein n=1 Tax=Trichomonas vaginalis (strain ATCC PRA-98 / G3) TaxID=412133 RepID=A2DSC3_TRIV3|nr:AATF protein (apoptosis antagonizing transcription factor) family [Trichomonas vaginalis G3]EAY16702.1 hypothetical protein TVAG_067070 [Trichomonas vaginalis G3]KAI5543128.1 AATF protein (apoptosis antagonizing transcription factor) family [Trichomonas vaginalis G3]|eukprot:XP_001328925.1 hypothetical protein [Trichomonas vaginalis G3]